MIAAIILAAGFAASPSAVCHPAAPTPAPIAGPPTVVTMKSVWAADRQCRAGGVDRLPSIKVRPRQNPGIRLGGPSAPKFDPTWAEACFVADRNEIVLAADTPPARRPAVRTHEDWHAAGYTHPDSLNGCGTWVRSQPLIDAIKAGATAREGH